MHPRMVDLVSKKWERFARRIFFVRFLGTLAYLFIFLTTTILDQTRTETVFVFLSNTRNISLFCKTRTKKSVEIYEVKI